MRLPIKRECEIRPGSLRRKIL